jgi:hypothetical protein
MLSHSFVFCSINSHSLVFFLKDALSSTNQLDISHSNYFKDTSANSRAIKLTLSHSLGFFLLAVSIYLKLNCQKCAAGMASLPSVDRKLFWRETPFF